MQHHTRTVSSKDPSPYKAVDLTTNKSSVSYSLDEAEEYAKEILREKGLPTEYPQPDNSEANVFESVKGKELEPEWFAAHILHYAYATRIALKDNDAEKAVWNALRLEEKIGNLYFTYTEYATLVGLKQLSSDKNTTYTEEDKKTWKAIAEELWKNTRYLNNMSDTARYISKKTGSGYESVRKYISKLPHE